MRPVRWTILAISLGSLWVAPASPEAYRDGSPSGDRFGTTFGTIPGASSSYDGALGDSDLTESDYSAIPLLERILDTGDDLTRVYVSNADEGDLPLGNDAYPGTVEMPIRTIDRARNLANSAGRTWILLDSADTWSDNGVCSGVEQPYPCCTGSGTGTCGCSEAGTCELGDTFSPLDPNALPDEVGVRISSMDPTGQGKSRIRCNTLEFHNDLCIGLDDPAPCCSGNATGTCRGPENAKVFEFAPDSGDEGWVVIENIDTSLCGGYDHYSTTSAGAKFLALGARCSASRSAVDNSGHCIVMKNSSIGVSVNGRYVVEDDGVAGISNDTLALAQTASGSPLFIDLFGDYDMNDQDYKSFDGNTVRVHDDSEAFFLGSVIRNSGENSGAGGVQMIDISPRNAGDTPMFTAVRTLIGLMSNDGDFDDTSAAIRPRTSLASQSVEARLIQSTFANAPVAIFTSNLAQDSSVFVFGRGVLWDNPPNSADSTSYYINNNLLAGDAPVMEFDVDFSRSTFDDGEGADTNNREWNVGGTPSSKITCAAALSERLWTNFFDDCDSAYDSDDGVGVPAALDNDGDQFRGRQDLATCADGEICDGGFPDVYVETLPFAIPEFFLGRRLTGLILGGPGGDIGAPILIPEPTRHAQRMAALVAVALVIALRIAAARRNTFREAGKLDSTSPRKDLIGQERRNERHGIEALTL